MVHLLLCAEWYCAEPETRDFGHPRSIRGSSVGVQSVLAAHLASNEGGWVQFPMSAFQQTEDGNSKAKSFIPSGDISSVDKILVVAYVVMCEAVNLKKWMQIPSTNLRALSIKVVFFVCNEKDREHYPESPFIFAAIVQRSRILPSQGEDLSSNLNSSIEHIA